MQSSMQSSEVIIYLNKSSSSSGSSINSESHNESSPTQNNDSNSNSINSNLTNDNNCERFTSCVEAESNNQNGGEDDVYEVVELIKRRKVSQVKLITRFRPLTRRYLLILILILIYVLRIKMDIQCRILT